MRVNAMTEKFEDVTVLGHPMLFTCARVDRATVPEGLYITNVAADTYTLDWNKKTISITAYAETKAENNLISEYIEDSPLKFKRVIQKA